MSRRSRKKRVSASKIEIHRVTFSPDSDERINTGTVRNDILTHGTIKLTIKKRAFRLRVKQNLIS